MDSVKEKLIGFLIIVAIIVIPVSLLATLTNWFVDAIKWIVFIDNTETGLPMWAEMLVKGIIEGLTILIAGYIGIKEKSLTVLIAGIVFSFAACVAIYFIAKYIIWILIGLLLIVIVYIVYKVIRNNQEKNNKGELSND